MIGKLTSKAILSSPLAVWGTYIDPATLEPVKIKIIINHDVERWDGHVTLRRTEISYAYFPDHPLRRHATITIGSQDYQITEVVGDDGFLITSAVKRVRS